VRIEVIDYLNDRNDNQSRPTVLEVLNNTSCKNERIVHSHMTQYYIDKYKVRKIKNEIRETDTDTETTEETTTDSETLQETT